MRSSSSHLTVVALALAVAAALVPCAGASPATVERLQSLSTGAPPSVDTHLPFACDPLYEYEPELAVNPKQPDNIVAAWIQGLALHPNGIATSVSHNGGGTWTQGVVPGLSGCSGADADTVAEDPRLAFNRDGSILYLVSLRFSWDRNAERVLVSRSTDNGDKWSEPVTVDDDSPLNGETWLTTDPHDADKAYVIWTEKQSSPQKWTSYLAVTADGGKQWETKQTPLYDPPTGVLPQDP